MKRTSIIWIFILAVAVLATVTTTYFLLDLKKKELDKRGETSITDKSQELTILNSIYKLRENLDSSRTIKDLEIDGESVRDKVTDVSLGTLKVAVPYELEEEKEDPQSVDSKSYTSVDVAVSIERASYKDKEQKDIEYVDAMSLKYNDMNKFITMDSIKSEDIKNLINSYNSIYELYLELLSLNPETRIEYNSDKELKEQFIKYYLASEIQIYNNIYKNDEEKLLFIHNGKDGKVTGGYITVFRNDNIYELYLLYNIEKTVEEVESDFDYIIKTIKN